jgi:SAM-dependent methyltransferase
MTPPKSVQRWQADDYARKGRFVSELARPVVDLLAPKRGERILDLGCGDGVLTELIAAYGADVLCGDLSKELLAAAAAKGLEVQRVDGHALPFEAEFDAVFTNAALHWMRRPELVIAGVARALKPHGRFVGEFGGHGNVAAITTAVPRTATRTEFGPQITSGSAFVAERVR